MHQCVLVEEGMRQKRDGKVSERLLYFTRFTLFFKYDTIVLISVTSCTKNIEVGLKNKKKNFRPSLGSPPGMGRTEKIFLSPMQKIMLVLDSGLDAESNHI